MESSYLMSPVIRRLFLYCHYICCWSNVTNSKKSLPLCTHWRATAVKDCKLNGWCVAGLGVWREQRVPIDVKRCAGVAPEVNMRNPLRAWEKARKWGNHPGFETKDRYQQKSKRGVSVVPQQGLVSSKKKSLKNCPHRNYPNDGMFNFH